MDVEEAFQVVGEFGPYQRRAVAVLVLTQVSYLKKNKRFIVICYKQLARVSCYIVATEQR